MRRTMLRTCIPLNCYKAIICVTLLTITTNHAPCILSVPNRDDNGHPHFLQCSPIHVASSLWHTNYSSRRSPKSSRTTANCCVVVVVSACMLNCSVASPIDERFFLGNVASTPRRRNIASAVQYGTPKTNNMSYSTMRNNWRRKKLPLCMQHMFEIARSRSIYGAYSPITATPLPCVYRMGLYLPRPSGNCLVP